MNATTDKDYIDAKLEGTSAYLLGEIRAANAEYVGNLKEYQAQSIARMEMLELTIKAGMKSTQDELMTKLALIEATNYRLQSDIIKWVMGAVISGTAVTISFTSVMLNSSGHKSTPSAPVPIVVYAQPAPAAQAVPAPPQNRPE